MYFFWVMTCFLARDENILAKTELHRSLQVDPSRAPDSSASLCSFQKASVQDPQSDSATKGASKDKAQWILLG